MKKRNGKRFFSGLSSNTVLLTFASLFADISTEMLYPVLPVFLTQILHANGSVVGIVDGVATATQNIIQGFSGWLSDRIQKRKPLALAGYLLAALTKPLIGVSSVWQQVLAIRFTERMGTGIRSAPRDALIASSADEQNRGKAFGLEGIGDNMGAFLGPLLAVFLLFFVRADIRSIFYLTVIPGLLAFMMVLLVKEKRIVTSAKSTLEIHAGKFPAGYWKYLFVTALFGIGNSSNAFLILQTRAIGVSLETTILIYAFYNLFAALSSYPTGVLSDMFGRKNIMLFSFFIFSATYLGFALTKNEYIIGALFILYGIYQGTFRSVGKAYASDFVPHRLRASSIGWYSTTVGLSGLVASIVAGMLWDTIGHPAVFFYGAGFSILGSIAMLALL